MTEAGQWSRRSWRVQKDARGGASHCRERGMLGGKNSAGEGLRVPGQSEQDSAQTKPQKHPGEGQKGAIPLQAGRIDTGANTRYSPAVEQQPGSQGSHLSRQRPCLPTRHRRPQRRRQRQPRALPVLSRRHGALWSRSRGGGPSPPASAPAAGREGAQRAGALLAQLLLPAMVAVRLGLRWPQLRYQTRERTALGCQHAEPSKPAGVRNQPGVSTGQQCCPLLPARWPTPGQQPTGLLRSASTSSFSSSCSVCGASRRTEWPRSALHLGRAHVQGAYTGVGVYVLCRGGCA